MATRYCGPGGNDGNSGLTWALRKLTLNGVEDTPVVAGDVCYIGPGVYRELLTVDVSGGAGTEIEYIGDVTGEHTDGVGGIVRITGSDNDTSAARVSCINANGKDYRIFRGFHFDSASAQEMILTSCAVWIIEDCSFEGGFSTRNIDCTGADQSEVTIRRSVFIGGAYAIRFENGGQIDNAQHLVENCILSPYEGDTITLDEVFGVTIRNCFINGDDGVDSLIAGAGGETPNVVENCTLAYCGGAALEAGAVGDIVEDYNNFTGNATDRTNVAVGGNSLSYCLLLLPPILHAGASQASGFKFPWWFGELSEWSQLTLTGSNEPTEDLRGLERPTTAAKNTWGPLQFQDFERETGTVRTGSVSAVLHDAGVHQIIVPVTNVSTTISVWVYREANYAGNNPQMIIKQPGQADDTTTDAAAASQWNELTTTLTPAALPPYVIIELKSRNTAVALAYDVFWDDLTVS